jgi:hypothetical protein
MFTWMFQSSIPSLDQNPMMYLNSLQTEGPIDSQSNPVALQQLEQAEGTLQLLGFQSQRS